MQTSVLLAYLLIILSVSIWGLIPALCRKISSQTIQHISVFAGAFLLASCFVNLVPHLFLATDNSHFVSRAYGFKIASAVLIGFLIQLLTEQMTHGVEHAQQQAPSQPPFSMVLSKEL